MTSEELARVMADVARLVWGEPNPRMSSAKELRWGSKGARRVDLEKGVFFDSEAGEGGGTLAFLAKEQGLSGDAAYEWLEEKGLKPPEDHRQNGHVNGQDIGKRDAAIAKTYDYVDEAGRPIFQVCRMAPHWPHRFLQRHREGAGWKWTIKGLRQVPYRLPELVEAIERKDLIFVCEGEKDTDNLMALGVPATTNAAGAGNIPDDMVKALAGADVVILEDNDDAGRKRTAALGARLRKVARRVRVLRFADMEKGNDVSDWLAAGHDAEAFYAKVAKEAALWLPSDLVSAFGAVHWRDLDKPGPEHEWLIKKVLTRRERSMLYGPSQSGKSFAAYHMSMCIARGVPYRGRKVRQGGVVYFALESGTGFKLRMRAYREAHQVGPDIDFVLLTKRANLYADPSATDALIAEIKMHAALMTLPLELVVLDTWSAGTAGADEIKGKDVSVIMERVNRIMVECGCHVMIVHHMNASGERPRGHTSMFADIEQCISVVKSDEEKDDDGRLIRTMRVEKQKEGEDGDTFPFILRSVTVSVDEDGDPITSCVCEPPAGEAKTPVEHAASQGIKLTPNDAVAFQALLDALSEMGTVAPGEFELPVGTKAVKYENWLAYYRRMTFEDGGPPKDGESEADTARRQLEASYKALQRAGAQLLHYGLLMKRGTWVWWTGKAVKGFRVTQKARHFDDKREPLGSTDDSSLPDDVDDLF